MTDVWSNDSGEKELVAVKQEVKEKKVKKEKPKSDVVKESGQGRLKAK